MNSSHDFEDIRPFYAHEAKDAIQIIKKDPLFFELANYIWPKISIEELNLKADKVTDNIHFQLEFMHEAIRTILSRSSTGLSCSGFENIKPNESYLFISNHRDIILDSAILQVLLVENGFLTSEICFGDNLIENDFISDFFKLNRMFTVQREGSNRELYEISQKLSAYIHHTLTDKKVSVWIAQRNGRTKDGNDITQTGLVKMLNMNGKNNFIQNMKELKIVPVSISYEYEPCDVLKVNELNSTTQNGKYEKAPGEDLKSIVTGIQQAKGKIHLSVGKPIISDLEKIDSNINENEQIKLVASTIDEQIYSNYQLWPNNYIAYDLLCEVNQFKEKYSEQEKNNFIDYLKKQAACIKENDNTLINLFLQMYANPVVNFLQMKDNLKVSHIELK